MLVFFASGNAKVLSFALADAKVPNASSFGFWWNIGLREQLAITIFYSTDKSIFVICLFLQKSHVYNSDMGQKKIIFAIIGQIWENIG